MLVACGLWLLCTIVFRVGLKLALCCNIVLLESLKLIMLPVPHRHKALLQPGGGLSLFFRSSWQSCGWWNPSFYQFERRVVFLALTCPPFFRREIPRLRFLISPLSFLTRSTRLSLIVERVVLFNTRCCRTPFSLTSATARLSNYPSRSLRPTLSSSS